MLKNIPVYEILLDDNEIDGLQFISLVNRPAIEKTFIKLNKKLVTLAKNDEKRIVTGPAMIPDLYIDRRDFYWVFSAETIVKLNENFFKNFKQQSINIEHSTNTNNNTVIESWIIEDPNNDKSNALGLSDLPKGTWMVSMKIDNDDTWERVKSGELLGFSIEGFLSQQLIENSEKNVFDNETLDYLEELINNSKYNNDDIDTFINEIEEITKIIPKN